MIVYADSQLGVILAFMVLVSGILLVLASLRVMLTGNFRRAAVGICVSILCFAVYAGGVMAVSVLSPQKIVNVGDTYCSDIWCIGIDKVNATPRGTEVFYKIDVHIFSSSKTAASVKGTSLYLLDERGRRFTSSPFDVDLKPGQTVNASLSFVTAADSKNLFLNGKAGQPPFWTRLYFGSDDSLLHKPTLLRVL